MLLHVTSLRKHEMKKPVKDETGSVPFSIRLSKPAKLALDKEAAAQGRPSANLAQWIVVEWLKAKSLLK
ncbi:MAG TPA: hypothetical protein VIE66_16325 [Methylocella sp.]